MLIFAVDDEPLALENITDAIKKAAPKDTVRFFRSAEDAMKAAAETAPDVAFLDIKLRTQSGIELAQQLLSLKPRLNVIFTTGYRDYMETAFEMHASGYIVKPVTEEKIKRELANLRYPVPDEYADRLRVVTFGDFEVFAGDEPISFSLQKTRELMAILINQNGLSYNSKLADILWEDGQGLQKHGSYFQNILSDLNGTLAKHGCANVLIRRKGLTGLDKRFLDCDYYDFLAGKPEAVRAFHGKYMSLYSWAEETLAFLLQKEKQFEMRGEI